MLTHSEGQTAFANGPVTELPPALKRQFYPTLLLLICLLPAYQYEYRARREVDRPLTVNHSPHQVFRDFLSKLAFLCCTDPGSNAVAACAIFKRMDDTIVYVLAFNSRSARELEVLKEKTASLLKQFGSPPFTDDRKKAILRLALSSNANRVRSYLKAFQKHLATCIEACERDDNNDSTSYPSFTFVRSIYTGSVERPINLPFLIRLSTNHFTNHCNLSTRACHCCSEYTGIGRSRKQYRRYVFPINQRVKNADIA